MGPMAFIRRYARAAMRECGRLGCRKSQLLPRILKLSDLSRSTCQASEESTQLLVKPEIPGLPRRRGMREPGGYLASMGLSELRAAVRRHGLPQRLLRFADADEIARALEPFTPPETPTGAPTGVPPQVPPPEPPLELPPQAPPEPPPETPEPPPETPVPPGGALVPVETPETPTGDEPQVPLPPVGAPVPVGAPPVHQSGISAHTTADRACVFCGDTTSDTLLTRFTCAHELCDLCSVTAVPVGMCPVCDEPRMPDPVTRERLSDWAGY